MLDKIKNIVVEQLMVDADQVTEDASFVDDLGADSLDIVELIKVYRKNDKLSEKEQKLFKSVLILSAISIVLFAVFVFFVFGTNW